MPPKPVTLFALNNSIKKLIDENLNVFWVSAEINELKINYSGHCYLELIQKDEQSEKILARCRAIIWAQTFRMIQPYFESTTGQSFTEGIKVMVKARVDYNEIYGLSLNIMDIEPSYTVGELAIRKQQIIAKLKAEGVFEMNKEFELKDLVQRIAVISSKTAAGLGDFMDQLNNNPYNLVFKTTLFPAVMQGAEAESSIIEAFDKIYQQEDNFDVVVLIRGGGSQTDLECFNSYWLSYHISQFPLPVFTGIGHEQDETIADMVAHTKLKTPTAVAEHLIDLMLEQKQYLDNLSTHIITLIEDQLDSERQQLIGFTNQMYKQVNGYVSKEDKRLLKLTHKTNIKALDCIVNKHQYLNNTKMKLKGFSKNNFINKNLQLKHLYKELANGVHHFQKQRFSFLNEKMLILKSFNPEVMLQKGFTMTFKDGKLIKSKKELTVEDNITTLFADGKITSKIERTDEY